MEYLKYYHKDEEEHLNQNRGIMRKISSLKALVPSAVIQYIDTDFEKSLKELRIVTIMTIKIKIPQITLNNIKEIQKLRQEMMMKDIDRDLAEITKADKSINDVKLLEIANKYNCSVKDAYNIYRGQNIDKIIADEKATMNEEIIAELKANSDSTSTLITSGDKTNDNGDFGLTEIELAFAEKLGMTPKEYAENKSNPW